MHQNQLKMRKNKDPHVLLYTPTRVLSGDQHNMPETEGQQAHPMVFNLTMHESSLIYSPFPWPARRRNRLIQALET